MAKRFICMMMFFIDFADVFGKIHCRGRFLYANEFGRVFGLWRRKLQLQKVPQPSKPTWVSVQDVVLNSIRPSTQPSQPLPELSHFYTHKQQKHILLMSLCVLVGVSRLDTKMMRSRQLTSFCQLHKSDQKHMSSQKVFTSRHGLFV